MVTHYTVDDLRVALGFAKPGSDEGVAPGAGRYASARPRPGDRVRPPTAAMRRGPNPTRLERPPLTRGP